MSPNVDSAASSEFEWSVPVRFRRIEELASIYREDQSGPQVDRKLRPPVPDAAPAGGQLPDPFPDPLSRGFFNIPPAPAAKNFFRIAEHSPAVTPGRLRAVIQAVSEAMR